MKSLQFYSYLNAPITVTSKNKHYCQVNIYNNQAVTRGEKKKNSAKTWIGFVSKNASMIMMLLLRCSVAGGGAVQKGATPTTSAMVTTARVQGRDTRMEFGPKATFLTQGNAVLLLFLDTGLGLWGFFFFLKF